MPRSAVVTPNEMARNLGVTGLQFRNWLRSEKARGHPLLVGHQKHERYRFTPEEARRLAAEYRRSQTGPRVARPTETAPGQTSPSPAARVSAQPVAAVDQETPGHLVVVHEDGELVTTLRDLLRPNLIAVVVGINPAPVSVAAGHYWRSRTGQTLWRRLRRVGLLPDHVDGFEDDAAFAAGVGFTDVVKRPTTTATEISEAELRHGLDRLREKLVGAGAPLVIFAFKKAATTLLGPFPGNGFVPGLAIGRSEVFVMPGPYESNESADVTLDSLRRWVLRARQAR